MSLFGADLGEPEERLLTERLHLVHTNQSHAHAHVSPSNHLRNGKEPPATAPRGSAHKSKTFPSNRDDKAPLAQTHIACIHHFRDLRPGMSTPGSLGGTRLLSDKTHDSIKLRTDESERRGGWTDRQMGRWGVCGKGRRDGEYSYEDSHTLHICLPGRGRPPHQWSGLVNTNEFLGLELQTNFLVAWTS
ncbi:hypothetical protein MHYP_G00124880 [Metynnis hypsauchen]